MENDAVFNVSHSTANCGIYLQLSDSLVDCQYHKVTSAMSISSEMQWFFSRVIRPESLCIHRADNFLTERPNYAAPLAANSMRNENPPSIALCWE